MSLAVALICSPSPTTGLHIVERGRPAAELACVKLQAGNTADFIRILSRLLSWGFSCSKCELMQIIIWRVLGRKSNDLAFVCRRAASGCAGFTLLCPLSHACFLQSRARSAAFTANPASSRPVPRDHTSAKWRAPAKRSGSGKVSDTIDPAHSRRTTRGPLASPLLAARPPLRRSRPLVCLYRRPERLGPARPCTRSR